MTSAKSGAPCAVSANGIPGATAADAGIALPDVSRSTAHAGTGGASSSIRSVLPRAFEYSASVHVPVNTLETALAGARSPGQARGFEENRSESCGTH